MPSDLILNPMLRLRGYLVVGETLHVRKTRFLLEEDDEIRLERQLEGVEIEDCEEEFGIDRNDTLLKKEEDWDEAFASDQVPLGNDCSWEDEWNYPIDDD